MRINKLAIPLMLNSVSSTIISLCDQAMVGRTYLEGFASVGIIGSNIYSITGILGALSVGLNILGSKAKGKDDSEDLNNSLFSSIIFSIILGCIFFEFFIIFGEYILKNFFNIYGNTLKDATIYLRIFSLSIGLNLILFNLSSYFKIINKARYILYGNLISSISNVLFDYVLIFGRLGFPTLGICGNAIGSVLALVLALVFYIVILKKYNLIAKTKINIFVNARKIIILSTPLVLQEFVESTIIVFMMNYILSQIGLLEVSIYNLIFSIINIALMPMYAYAQASLNIISEDLGANKDSTVVYTVKTCINRALLFYIIICLFILLLKDYIPSIITNDINLIINSSKYIFIAIVANFMNVPSCVLKHSIQALGGEKFVFIYSSIISILSTLLIYIFIYIFNNGLNIIYLGLMINHILVTITLFIKFLNFTNKGIMKKCIKKFLNY